MAKKKFNGLKDLDLLPEIYAIYEKLEGFIKRAEGRSHDDRTTRYGFATSIKNIRLGLLGDSYPPERLAKQARKAERYLINRYPEYKAFLRESSAQPL